MTAASLFARERVLAGKAGTGGGWCAGGSLWTPEIVRCCWRWCDGNEGVFEVGGVEDSDCADFSLRILRCIRGDGGGSVPEGLLRAR